MVRTDKGFEHQINESGTMGIMFAGMLVEFASPDLLAVWMNENPPL